MNQSKYALDILTKFGMASTKPCISPCSVGSLYTESQPCSSEYAKSYRSMVGALHYLTFTRPDLSFAVSRVSQFMHAPTYHQLIAVKHILRYVRGTLSASLCFRRSFLSLSAYSDLDWAGDCNDPRSTTGFVLMLGSNPISWVSKKQTTVSHSSTEAEYRALAATTTKVSWVRQILKELYVFLPRAPLLLCDNQFALLLARNPVFHGRTKHVEIDLHFVREKVASRDLQLQFVPTLQQPADIFTKALTVDRLLFLRCKFMAY